ncbi:hypothetical protein TNCV_1030221 [Trichonephila clavipes]|uniref:Uncharacterized protein n=1 Tax=Trichonephila inaurata madagascariensis TaxID=2747483 RepID=A0A8X6XES1_9ARAC|nr:hypothetical protein TNCV_1030221 [Trichonephila clavipes]GFY52447.1 hypothetical protein TNIN_218331 [Trichonephila inaurata madagascariensis]
MREQTKKKSTDANKVLSQKKMGYSVRSINLPFLEQQTVNSLQGDIYPLLRKKGIGQRPDQEVQRPKVSTTRFRKEIALE